MGSWTDKLVSSEKDDNKQVVDNLHLGSAVARMKSEDGLDPVQGSVLDRILTRSRSEPLTFGALKERNPDLASAYLSEI